MYGIIALISAWIRQFYLPNPFVNIIDPLYADLFNIIIGGFIIHILAYYITGCIYENGSSPGLGSFFILDKLHSNKWSNYINYKIYKSNMVSSNCIFIDLYIRVYISI